MRAPLLAVLILALPSLARADAPPPSPADGKMHLARAESLEKIGRREEAAREAQTAFWLDASLKDRVDALLARVQAQHPAGAPFAPEKKDSWGRWVFLLAATLAILFFAGRFVRFRD